MFFGENRFDDAHAHVERAKSHATNRPYNFGRAMELQAWFWYKRHMLEEAKSEALLATNVFEKIGAAKNCGALQDSPPVDRSSDLSLQRIPTVST